MMISEHLLLMLEDAGFVIMPKEPTAEMIEAGMRVAKLDLASEYRAMVSVGKMKIEQEPAWTFRQKQMLY